MKKLLLAICICNLALTGCTPKEKTTVLEENVLLNEINYANKITKEKLDLKLENGYQFEPGYFYNDKVYGIIRNQEEPDSKLYRGYYSKSEGLVKEDEILPSEAFSDISYKNRRVISYQLDYNNPVTAFTNTIEFRDNVTGEIKSFEVPLVEQSGIRVPASNKSVEPYIKELLNQTASDGLDISIGSKNSTVIGDNNYGYTVNTIWTFQGDMP